MVKKIISLAVLVCLLAYLPGCGAVVRPGPDGLAVGEPGDRMRTALFDFTLHTATESPDYDGVRPSPGEKLVLLDISIRNTSGREISLYDTDFHLLWGESGYTDTIGTAHADMAPPQLTLAPRESARYIYAFAVPGSVYEFRLCFLDNALPEGGTPPQPTLFYVVFATA